MAEACNRARKVNIKIRFYACIYTSTYIYIYIIIYICMYTQVQYEARRKLENSGKKKKKKKPKKTTPKKRGVSFFVVLFINNTNSNSYLHLVFSPTKRSSSASCKIKTRVHC